MKREEDVRKLEGEEAMPDDRQMETRVKKVGEKRLTRRLTINPKNEGKENDQS